MHINKEIIYTLTLTKVELLELITDLEQYENNFTTTETTGHFLRNYASEVK